MFLFNPVLFYVSLVFKVLLLIYWGWRNFALLKLSFRMPGPFRWPVVGNLPSLLFSRGTFLERANKIAGTYVKDFRFWFGSKLLYVAVQPETIESILTSEVLVKIDQHSFISPCADPIFKTDERWRVHKKLIKPLINVKLIIDNLGNFQNKIQTCLKQLEAETNKEIDVGKYIQLCYADIFGEIILGKNIEALSGKNVDFLAANQICVEEANREMIYEWLGLSWFYKCTSSNRSLKESKRIQKYFIENTIRKSWERRKLDVFGENMTSNVLKCSPIIDKIADFIEANPNVISNEEFRDYLLSFFLMSVNSMSIITSFLCLSFGLHPEYQKKAVEEIRSVFSKSGDNLKYEDIYKLKYLEMCILDVIRLVSVKPIHFRNFEGNIDIGGIIVPPKCTVIIPAQAINRDEKLFSRPEQFYPEHFTQDANKKCSVSMFGPAGAKECLGKQLSIVLIKVMLVGILRRFRIEAEGHFPDVKLKMDLYTRPVDGYKVRLKTREI